MIKKLILIYIALWIIKIIIDKIKKSKKKEKYGAPYKKVKINKNRKQKPIDEIRKLKKEDGIVGKIYFDGTVLGYAKQMIAYKNAENSNQIDKNKLERERNKFEKNNKNCISFEKNYGTETKPFILDTVRETLFEKHFINGNGIYTHENRKHFNNALKHLHNKTEDILYQQFGEITAENYEQLFPFVCATLVPDSTQVSGHEDFYFTGNASEMKHRFMVNDEKYCFFDFLLLHKPYNFIDYLKGDNPLHKDITNDINELCQQMNKREVSLFHGNICLSEILNFIASLNNKKISEESLCVQIKKILHFYHQAMGTWFYADVVFNPNNGDAIVEGRYDMIYVPPVCRIGGKEEEWNNTDRVYLNEIFNEYFYTISNSKDKLFSVYKKIMRTFIEKNKDYLYSENSNTDIYKNTYYYRNIFKNIENAPIDFYIRLREMNEKNIINEILSTDIFNSLKRKNVLLLNPNSYYLSLSEDKGYEIGYYKFPNIYFDIDLYKKAIYDMYFHGYEDSLTNSDGSVEHEGNNIEWRYGWYMVKIFGSRGYGYALPHNFKISMDAPCSHYQLLAPYNKLDFDYYKNISNRQFNYACNYNLIEPPVNCKTFNDTLDFALKFEPKKYHIRNRYMDAIDDKNIQRIRDVWPIEDKYGKNKMKERYLEEAAFTINSFPVHTKRGLEFIYVAQQLNNTFINKIDENEKEPVTLCYFKSILSEPALYTSRFDLDVYYTQFSKDEQKRGVWDKWRKIYDTPRQNNKQKTYRIEQYLTYETGFYNQKKNIDNEYKRLFLNKKFDMYGFFNYYERERYKGYETLCKEPDSDYIHFGIIL